MNREEYMEAAAAEVIAAGELPVDVTSAHRRYYGQFVDEETKRLVKLCIGEERLRESSDKHFNDIPIRKWDAMAGAPYNPVGFYEDKWRPPQSIVNKIAEIEGESVVSVSLPDCICIYKEAARQIVEESSD